MLTQYCRQMARRKKADTLILWTGSPFISELRTFQSNSSWCSSRPCFSTSNVHGAFLAPYSLWLIDISNYNNTGWFQMWQCFREQRVRYESCPEKKKTWFHWAFGPAGYFLFTDIYFFNWSAHGLSCCPQRSRKRNRDGKHKLSLLFFLYNKRSQQKTLKLEAKLDTIWSHSFISEMTKGKLW